MYAKSTLELVGARSAVRHEPLGLVLILAPWNYPFHLAIIPLISAIAAGNCVVLKPSNKTSNTARVIAKLISSTFNQDEVAVVTGDHRIADALLDQPFDHVFFTGSLSLMEMYARGGGRGVSLSVNKRLAGDKTRQLLSWSPKRYDILEDTECGSYNTSADEGARTKLQSGLYQLRTFLMRLDVISSTTSP